MSRSSDYAELIDYLNTRDAQERERKKHRLPIELYARSDCEYFLTICARQQGEPFLDPALAQAVVDSLLWQRRKSSWTLPCYCLMPDHLHFIARLVDAPPCEINAGVRGTIPAGIIDQIARFKSYTTTQIWWKSGRSGPLWQRSSFDRVIRYDRSLDAAARYVLDNPVRKGLSERWEDYPYAAVIDPW